MTICINALSASLGGGITYIANLAPILNTPPGDKHTFILLLAKGQTTDLSLPSNVRCLHVYIPFGNSILRVVYEQLVLPFLLFFWQVDLLFTPQDMVTLFSPCPVVIALRNPNLYTRLKQGWRGKDALRIAILGVLARISVWKAQRVIFVSKDSRQWISQNINLSLNKSVVVYHGIDPDIFSKQDVIDVKKKYNLVQPFILSVSTIYRYKNFVRLIEAYDQLCQIGCQHDLVIVGKNLDPPYWGIMKKKVQDLNLETRVHLIGGVEYRCVFSFFQNADVFVFPSYLETFGHPLLEAMALGVPVIASDIQVFREIAGDAALYFDPYDVDHIASVLWDVLNDSKQKEVLRAEGVSRLKQFSWQKTVQETLQVFDEVIKKAE